MNEDGEDNRGRADAGFDGALFSQEEVCSSRSAKESFKVGRSEGPSFSISHST